MIADKYSLIKFVGEGKFGRVYQGKMISTSEYVAIKIETHSPIQPLSVKLLKHETTILNYLYRKGCRNIPIIHWFGIYKSFPTLVMTYFEKTLDSDNFTLVYCSKMISIIEKIHQQGIIHRDIKPSNFMLKGNDIFLIDFGLATFYVDEEFRHKENSKKEYIIGTPNYISIHQHDGHDASRRDDLISLGYVFLYCATSSFASFMFSNHNNVNVQISHDPVIQQMHIQHPFLLEKREGKKWKNLSQHLSPESCMFHYLDYCYRLDYDETPCYTYLRHYVEVDDGQLPK
jgi:serine/threonine protein kinase